MFSIDFSRRDPAQEIIDRPERLTKSHWVRILRELRSVNRWLGGERAALRELQLLVAEIAERDGHRPVRVVDFGCGSVDLGAALVSWARRKGYRIHVTGVDWNPLVCEIAQQHTARFPEIAIVRGDVRSPPLMPGNCDLILCSAFLHHFSNQEIVQILRVLAPAARQALVVSDLHRHPVAYLGIRCLTTLFSRSAAIRNDGPLSVLRGFRRRELEWILRRAKMAPASLKWRWAFRYVLVVPTESVLLSPCQGADANL